MNQAAFIEVNVHGMNVNQALQTVEIIAHRANKGVYRVRVIHGYNHGTAIKNAIRKEFGNGRERRVLRVEAVDNPGVTELVLREYY